MERRDYLNLRFAVEQEISNSAVDTDALVNNLMRLFLQSISNAEMKRQAIAQQFRSFKRNANTTAPSWAYKNPGLSDRIPTMKEAK
ncbi:hypothetical protein J3D54_004625 [Pseudomonas sp. GGS8]|uniref:hypothetical protein n=1 Tax=Pseudomonas sp. GGS8 TaxID=2817892 RepID=UPI00209DB275|nr:hypothetical protein [Pseudomonas sp. GGS8]MCP1445493.1 hypothetical protein [Pseudomonas sp. GGS8]